MIKKMKKVVTMMMCVGTSILYSGVTCFASSDTASVAEVMNPLNLLITLMLGVFSAIGIIACIKAVSDFTSAIHDRDSSSIKTSGLSFAGGLVMAALGPVLKWLGVY